MVGKRNEEQTLCSKEQKINYLINERKWKTKTDIVIVIVIIIWSGRRVHILYVYPLVPLFVIDNALHTNIFYRLSLMSTQFSWVSCSAKCLFICHHSLSLARPGLVCHIIHFRYLRASVWMCFIYAIISSHFCSSELFSSSNCCFCCCIHSNRQSALSKELKQPKWANVK